MVSISATQIVGVMQSWPDSHHLDLMSILVGVSRHGDHFFGVEESMYTRFYTSAEAMVLESGSVCLQIPCSHVLRFWDYLGKSG